ncbi:MarR family transcriptional regulator [Robbsia andropogonis]|uniref:MarR family transcriptional regulator n=1 Tax=Robbsia andropogonis TaxID=28092 RepID=A0A0F5K250_9BURK|nr:efflux transporter outer membrane subunit [Robbsia andropogonis]KKB63964.1 MarR family transcriptional regulator [Robbsia andropogonis]MCP1120246.1 efflux transporter outer membrane subunit [Robbsia andropogonis]MCP1130108.1 efflux transporter outer membrane subunit [Robbsia andropogonis]
MTAIRFTRPVLRVALLASTVASLTLSGCANYAGIHSDKQPAALSHFDTAQSLPLQGGNWPTMQWATTFGDPQLQALIDEGIANSPTIAEAQARLNQAAAYTGNAAAALLPHVNANYSLKRELYSGKALYPPPYGGNWYTENNLAATASYELDLWGKNRNGLKQAISQERAALAETQEAKLTLAVSIAQAYSALARQYALLDVAKRELQQRQDIGSISRTRFDAGLDTQVETRTSEADMATARTQISQLEGAIVVTRYQLAALLGKGPDRGLQIAVPALATIGTSDAYALPADLPANLISRRPDIVAARWRVEAAMSGIKVAKANFYPNLNLSAAFGFDAFGFGNFLKFGSRQIQAGPAIDLPIFDAGALRAQLKDRYASFDNAVASYDSTLVQSLNDVATQVAQIRSTEHQQADAQSAYDAAQKAYDLAVIRYKGGLSTQLQVLSADQALLQQRQTVVTLDAQRRDQQIGLIKALGGGFDANADMPGSKPAL